MTTTIHSLDRPDTMPELAEWLERQLVGHTLGELIAELNVVQPPNPVDPPLEEMIDLDPVLENGLKCATESQIRRFFRHPKRLLELQEKVLVDGGEYWGRVPRSREIVESSERVFKALQQSIVTQPASAMVLARPRNHSPVRWILTLAALVVMGVMTTWLIPHARVTDIAWTSATFAPTSNREEFFARLVVPPKKWLDQTPTTPNQLYDKLSRFREGCQQLVLHEDGIPEQDRKWLVEACRKWSSKLDELMAETKDLSATRPSRPFEEIRADATGLIERLLNRIEAESKA